MVKKRSPRVAPVESLAAAGSPEASGGQPEPSPQEGYRLMQAFVQIRRAAVREAIIELATRLSEDGGLRG